MTWKYTVYVVFGGFLVCWALLLVAGSAADDPDTKAPDNKLYGRWLVYEYSRPMYMQGRADMALITFNKDHTGTLTQLIPSGIWRHIDRLRDLSGKGYPRRFEWTTLAGDYTRVLRIQLDSWSTWRDFEITTTERDVAHWYEFTIPKEVWSLIRMD